MSEIGTIAVKLAARTAEFERGMDRASRKLTGFRSAASTVAKASAVAFTALGGAIALVTQKASEQIRVERQLTMAAKASGQAFDVAKFKDFAAQLQSVTTMGDESTMKLGAMFAAFGVGQDSIQAIIPLLVDLEAAGVASADTLGKLFSRAIATGDAQLSRYGIVLSGAEKKQFKFGSQTERTAFLLKKLAGFQGQAAEAAKDATGRLNQLGNSFGDLLEDIGRVLDAPLATMFLGIRKTIEAISPEMRRFAGIALGIGTAITGITAAVAGLIVILPKLKPVWLSSLWPVLAPVLAIAAALGGVIATVGALKMAWDQNAEALAGVWRDFSMWVGKTWDEVVVGIKAGFRSVVEFGIKAIAFLRQQSPEETYAQLQDFRKNGIGGSAAANNLAEFGSDFLGGVKGSINDLVKSFGVGVDSILGAFGLKIEDVTKMFEGFGGTTVVTGKKVDDLGSAAGNTKVALSELADRVSALSSIDAATFSGATSESASSRLGMSVPTETIDIASEDLKARDAELSSRLDSVTGSAQSLAGSMGEAGDALNSVVAGFQNGGWIGAIVGAIFAVVTQTESFGGIVTIFNRSFNLLVRSLEPMVNVIMHVIGGLFESMNALHLVADSIGKITGGMKIFKLSFEWIGYVFRAIGLGIAKAYNWVLEQLAKFVGWFKDSWAKKIRKHKVSLAELSGVESPSNDEGLNGAVDAMKNLSGAAKETAESMRRLNNEILNGPAGFKVDLRSFQATAGVAAPGADFPEPEQSTRSGPMAVFNIRADDPDDMMRKLRRVEDFRSFVEGAKQTLRKPYAVSRAGG